MFEFTNDERKCFGLLKVEPSWEKVLVTASPYDTFETYAYIDGNVVRKLISICSDEGEKFLYREYELKVELSEDKAFILPKTAKGKAKPFTSSNIYKATPIGMAFLYSRGNISVWSCDNQKNYYQSVYDGIRLNGFDEFKSWLDNWVKETDETQLEDVERFSKEKRNHQKFKEGDFFRFKINRKLYGYGRLLIDFSKMKKDNIPYWNVFMGKPICAAVYHIATERADVSPEELEGLMTLPPQMIMDNGFFYGEFEVIGNKEINEADWDYPVHYGEGIEFASSSKKVHYQCGKKYIVIENESALYNGFRHNGIGWTLDVKLPVFLKCIEEHSNMPFWNSEYIYSIKEDLRNPKFEEELKAIRRQVGILYG